MSRCYAYIVAYISRLEIGNVVLRPARLEVGHYDISDMSIMKMILITRTMHIARLRHRDLGSSDFTCIRYSTVYWITHAVRITAVQLPCTYRK